MLLMEIVLEQEFCGVGSVNQYKMSRTKNFWTSK